MADTTRSLRILETAHAPAYYIPRADVDMDLIRPSTLSSVCEFKGRAVYGDLVIGAETVANACWWYPRPHPRYAAITDAICFYPQRVDLCEVGGEAVVPLESSFYGDWPTSRIAGPYKGGPGTEWW